MSEHRHDMTNTHILVHDFEYVEPATLDEAVQLLAERGDEAALLAGGTYLLIQMKMERAAPRSLINVAHLPGLKGLTQAEGGLRVGALTTIRDLRNAPEIQERYTALAEACAAFGSTQIQIMGTVGGNVCNGSPASDTVPALLAFDAQARLAGPEGERELPVEALLVAPGEVALEPGELLTELLLPEPAPNAGSAFIKISRVAADLAKANVAAVLEREGDTIKACRLAYGSVGPVVIRVREAEEVLVGQPFSAELALEAGRIASEQITPIDDVRSTAWYRHEVVKVLTHDVLQMAWQRAGEQVAVGTGTEPAGLPVVEGTGGEGWHLGPGDKRVITLTVNGVRHDLAVAPNDVLLNVLREQLQLTGAKYGCGIGECGACTVQLNGQPALSCLVLAVAADGSDVLTVEGLQAPDGSLHPLQEAFIEENAFQCGYCTPGMLMMTKGLLQEIPQPAEDDVRDYLKGNRCRCTGFASIVRAVHVAVEKEEG